MTPMVPAQQAKGAPVLGQGRGQAGEGSCGWHLNTPESMSCLLLAHFQLLKRKNKMKERERLKEKEFGRGF